MKKKKLELSEARKQKAIEEIIKFFFNERDEEIGELAATILLDFILEKLAPAFYNAGIKDAVKFMSERVEDLYGLEK
ncbi:MAG TPA: DUF2164 domain-containing protein [Candidatus Cloacimonadota bacterium]|nr:DUF2164 domain-containing protein [Candidatus Cloacimonadota bacterium]